MLFAYACVLLASYANAASGYLPPDERKIGDHAMVTAFALIFVGLAVCDGVRSRDRLYFLLRVIVVCGSAVAVVGILQYLLQLRPDPAPAAAGHALRARSTPPRRVATV